MSKNKNKGTDSFLNRVQYLSLLDMHVNDGISVSYGKDAGLCCLKFQDNIDKSKLDSFIHQQNYVSTLNISDMIEQKYKGRDFEFLVADLLRVQGFQVQVTQPGPDGGVDILALNQRIGSDNIKLCVQVKSSINPVDYKVFRQFVGVLHKFQATHGLLVCWGGFSQAIKDEQAQMFFKVQLWSKEEVVSNFLKYYPQLDKKYRDAIPLRKVWALDVDAFKRNNSL